MIFFNYFSLGIGDWAQSPIPNPQNSENKFIFYNENFIKDKKKNKKKK